MEERISSCSTTPVTTTAPAFVLAPTIPAPPTKTPATITPGNLFLEHTSFLVRVFNRLGIRKIVCRIILALYLFYVVFADSVSRYMPWISLCGAVIIVVLWRHFHEARNNDYNANYKIIQFCIAIQGLENI